MNTLPEDALLIVGLGNPGEKYALTRHNIGFLVVQGLAYVHQWAFREVKSLHAQVAKGKVGSRTLHLVLPMTYMNESGKAVRAYLQYFDLQPRQLMVVTDDVDLPFGAMRLKQAGGAGGHNGLKSIQMSLQTQEYPRLRMGVGREQQAGRALADYVLEPFAPEERERLPSFIEEGIRTLLRLVDEDITRVMNAVNTRPKHDNSRPPPEGKGQENI